eukprot:Skav227015  [mRNA]  locus=scaffold456:58148:58411:+ [translate_table: standard]
MSISIRLLTLLFAILGSMGEMSEPEKFADNLFGLNAQRDVETLSRIQEEVQQQTGGSATNMDYFRAIVNDQGWQNNLWEDVWDMTHP